MATNKYNTVIVGGGIAGLTAAVYLARAGQKTMLIERNPDFGGLVSTFKRDGYQFEAGVRALESAGIIIPMLEELGINLEFARSKVSVGVEDKVLSIDNMASIDQYRDMLVSIYPESADELDTFLKMVLKVMKHLEVLYGIENPAFKDLKKETKYIFTKLLPWLPKFIFTVGKINRLNYPIEEYLEKTIKNRSLRDIISQHFFKGTPTFFALSYFSLYLDYFYPKGGVGKLADAVIDKYLEYGGELKPKTTALEVNATEQYVIDHTGTKYQYDNLIWAADLKTFYNVTDVSKLAPKTQTKFNTKKAEILKANGSESVFSLYLEVDKPLSYFRDISNGHFFYTPLKEGLGELHKSKLNHILENWEAITKEEALIWLDQYLTYNTYEISIPGLKDESLVPPNKSGLIVSFIIEFELFKKIKDNDWYDEFRSTIENKMIDVLSNSIYPNLKEDIDNHFSFTPISYKSRVASTDGAIVGWTMAESIPVRNHIQDSAKSVLTPIHNIFQAGQWAYSPAGVPMSILTGKLAADKIVK